MASLVTVTVRVRDATRAGLRQVQSSINSLNRGILTSMARGFRGGIGDSVAQGLLAASKNPYVAAAVVALVAVIVMQLGTLLAAALTLAFGGAFVALGVFAAAQSKKVKKDWSKTFKTIGKSFTDASKPMLPVIETARKELEKMATNFAPHFKKAMEAAAPFLQDFTKRMSSGIQKAGKTSFKVMMDAFNDLLSEIDIEGFFEDLGDAFANLGRAVSKNKEDVAGVFDGFLSVIPKVINVIAMLTEAWGEAQPFFSAVWRIVKILLTPAMIILGAVFEIINEHMDQMVGPLGTIADLLEKWLGILLPIIVKLTELAVWLSKRWELALLISGIGRIIFLIKKAAEAWGWIKRNWRAFVKFGGVNTVITIIRNVRTLWGWVKKNWKRVVKFAFSGGGVLGKLKDLWNWINRNWHRTISFSISGPLNLAKKIFGFAHGGVIGARIGQAATGGVRSNMTMVGEHGPELVDLPTGSRVRSNPDTRRLMAGQGGGGGNIVLLIDIGGKRLGELLIDPLRRQVKTKGGNDVQAYLKGA